MIMLGVRKYKLDGKWLFYNDLYKLYRKQKWKRISGGMTHIER